MEKIIALIFGLLALALEVWLSVKNPTVESVVAAAFALVIVVTMVVLIIRERRNTVVLEEDEPKGNRPVDAALKLANEIAPYIRHKDGRISIKVIK